MKLIYLEEVLDVKEYERFLKMLKKDWPKVYDAWMKNQAIVKAASNVKDSFER